MGLTNKNVVITKIEFSRGILGIQVILSNKILNFKIWENKIF